MDGAAGRRGPNNESLERSSKQEQTRPWTLRLNTDAQSGPSFDRAELVFWFTASPFIQRKRPDSTKEE